MSMEPRSILKIEGLEVLSVRDVLMNRSVITVRCANIYVTPPCHGQFRLLYDNGTKRILGPIDAKCSGCGYKIRISDDNARKGH